MFMIHPTKESYTIFLLFKILSLKRKKNLSVYFYEKNVCLTLLISI